MSVIDLIGRDVFQHQVRGIAEEMSMSLRRAAFSSIIWDMYDYSCGLFTPNGDMLSQTETIPAVNPHVLPNSGQRNIAEADHRYAWARGHPKCLKIFTGVVRPEVRFEDATKRITRLGEVKQ